MGGDAGYGRMVIQYYISTIQMTPCEVLYGYKPPILGIGSYENRSNATVRNLLEKRRKIEIQLKQNLRKAQERMKQYADKNRIERNFEVGEWVYLKLQPLTQTSIAMRKNLKLASKYYGPYEVQQRVGKWIIN